MQDDVPPKYGNKPGVVEYDLSRKRHQYARQGINSRVGKADRIIMIPLLYVAKAGEGSTLPAVRSTTQSFLSNCSAYVRRV